ncbi:MAG: hypothetical protein ACYCYO_18480 [Bacilli bacterium]
MNGAAADRLLSEIETVTEDVLATLAEHRPGDLEPLVVKQCQLMRMLETVPIQSIDQKRLSGLQDVIVRQQTLVAQALRVTDSFLQELSRMRAFNQVG